MMVILRPASTPKNHKHLLKKEEKKSLLTEKVKKKKS